MKLLEIDIVSDGGPWAEHNYPCPVFRDVPAVLDLNRGVFVPSWDAQKDGWRTVQAKGWRLWILRRLFSID